MFWLYKFTSTSNLSVCVVLLCLVVARLLTLPNGDTYSVRLYDALTIPFILGSDPLISIFGDNVEFVVFDTALGLPAPVQPTLYRKLTPYRVEVFYNVTLLSQTGQYSLRVAIGAVLMASTEFNLIVNRKPII